MYYIHKIYKIIQYITYKGLSGFILNGEIHEWILDYDTKIESEDRYKNDDGCVHIYNEKVYMVLSLELTRLD